MGRARSTLDNAIDHVIIHDWRYVNEYTTLARGGTAVLHTIRVVRNSVVAPMNVPSEHQLDMFETHYTLPNNGTRDDLVRALGDIVVGVATPRTVRFARPSHGNQGCHNSKLL